jgi:hypothetical protein
MLLAQLCWKLPGGEFPPYMALLTSNPEPGWVEEKFRPLIEEVGSGTLRSEAADGHKTYIQALPRDNPYLPPNWENEQRIDAPEVWIKKYLDGSWEVSEGQVYKEYDKATHVIDCPPPAFLSRLKLVASIDHATTGITCMAVDGIDPDGNVFALEEYYERNRLISEHAKSMCALMDRWVDRCGARHLVEEKRKGDPTVYPATLAFDYVLIDPSTQAKTQQNRTELWSVQDEYRRNGIATQAAWNALESGINLMSEYLHVKPTHIHPLTGQRGSPSFFILRELNPNGQREIVGWRRTMSDNKTVKYVGPDHWLDNQRYIVMSRPEPPRITTSDILSMDTASRIAQRSLLRFDKKFRTPGSDSGQWFPGGSEGPNTWFRGA